MLGISVGAGVGSSVGAGVGLSVMYTRCFTKYLKQLYAIAKEP